MALTLTMTPVYMRVGDGAEHQVGAFSPETVVLTPTEVVVSATKPLAALLRGVADYLDGNLKHPLLEGDGPMGND